jgi:ribosomal protein L11 methyltransferase
MARVEYMRIEARALDVGLAERAMAEAWASGAAGIEEREDGCIVVYAPAAAAGAVHAALAALAQEGLALRSAEVVEEVDWSERWKEGLSALEVSERLLIRPSFVSHGLAPGQRELVIDPGQAFGTGGHASTWLALEWVDRLLADPLGLARPARVLDVGTGTGVLALAALLLGARSAVGFDLDPVAVREARRWAEFNGVAARLQLFAGPVSALASGCFDLIVANLLRREILPIAEEVSRLLGARGSLVLSGLLASDREEVTATFARHGLEVVAAGGLRDATGDDWISLRLVHRGERPEASQHGA